MSTDQERFLQLTTSRSLTHETPAEATDRPRSYPQWTPEPFDPATDVLSEQVGDRETEAVQADPEIDSPPTITRVDCGDTAEPRVVDLPSNHEPADPNPPHIDRVEQRSHVLPQSGSEDQRFAGNAQAIVSPIGAETDE